MGPTRQRGATAVELTIALIVVLMLGLAVFQFVLVYRARLAIEQAAVEAARSGSTGHAGAEALQRGLARGLAPLLYGAADAADLQVSEARALAAIVAGQADGSISLRRLSPTDPAFADWEEPALDPFGEPIVGQMEIPNDNLDVRRTRSQPASGIAGYRGSEPIGAGSGLTLVDANLLRVELVYGARLTVPVAGRLLAATLSAWHGCGGGDSPAGGTAGGGAMAAADLCPHVLAEPPRLPLRAVATMRMMSPARRATAGGADGGGVPGGGDPAASDDRGRHQLVAIGEGSSPGRAPADSPDGQAGRGGRGNGSGGGGGGGGSGGGSGGAVGSPGSGLANGFLGIGSDRPYPHPALCAEG